MDVQIVKKEGFMLVGFSIQTKGGGDPATNDISQLWQRFNKVSNQIDQRALPEEGFGFMYFPDTWAFGDPFTYLAALKVNHLKDIPKDMEVYEVPAQEYAVINYEGVIDHIGEVYDFYYGEWLPASNYQNGNHFLFEYYGEKFLGNDNPKSEMSFYFPVEKKQASSGVHHI